MTLTQQAEMKMKKSNEAESRIAHGKAIQKYLMKNIKTHRNHMYSIIIQAGLDPRSFIAVGKRKPSYALRIKDLKRFDDDLLCYLATGEILDRAWGKGELDTTSAIVAMRTVPEKVYPTKLVKEAWKVSSIGYKPETYYSDLPQEMMEEESANLLYRKVRSSDGINPNCREYVSSLKPEVNDYLYLLDIIHYELEEMK
jgi:hypothetical protein